ncbi:hypothetical protein B0T26DRAFT_627966, partial [Lasiosphaeria miniovina]
NSTTTMPPKQQSSIAERMQELVLHAKGSKPAEIEAITGIKRVAFYRLLARAKERGYIPGKRVQNHHVENAAKTGRPK